MKKITRRNALLSLAALPAVATLPALAKTTAVPAKPLVISGQSFGSSLGTARVLELRDAIYHNCVFRNCRFVGQSRGFVHCRFIGSYYQLPAGLWISPFEGVVTNGY